MRYLLVFLIVNGCAASGFKRSFEHRTYRPCKEKESKKAGVFCYRKCVKYRIFKKRKSPNCKYWKYDRQDLSNPEVFKRFRDAGFTLRREL